MKKNIKIYENKLVINKTKSQMGQYVSQLTEQKEEKIKQVVKPYEGNQSEDYDEEKNEDVQRVTVANELKTSITALHIDQLRKNIEELELENRMLRQSAEKYKKLYYELYRKLEALNNED